jgi:vacuolar-type H+-ATPase subunit H
MLERFNAQTAQAIKNGWSNHNVRLGLSKYGVLGSIVGGVIEGAADIVTRPVGVLDEILSGAYGEAKDIVKKIMSDEYSTSSRMQNYIKYLSKDDDEILNKSYVGGDLINRADAIKDINSKISNAEHEYNETIDELKESQDNLKYGRLFGIDGAYDYNEVSKEWKQQR